MSEEYVFMYLNQQDWITIHNNNHGKIMIKKLVVDKIITNADLNSLSYIHWRKKNEQ